MHVVLYYRGHCHGVGGAVLLSVLGSAYFHSSYGFLLCFMRTYIVIKHSPIHNNTILCVYMHILYIYCLLIDDSIKYRIRE